VARLVRVTRDNRALRLLGRDAGNLKRLLVGLALVAWLLPSGPVGAQAPEPVFGDGPVPAEPYTSWSLFLPCNPEWLIDKQAEALRKVFEAYRALARTTGPRHAAVWFVKPVDGERGSVAANPQNLDVERSVLYCDRFGLAAAEGPHVVVTIVHPDRWRADAAGTPVAGDPIVILSLARSAPDDITRLLTRLTDQIRAERLSQQALQSEQYWRGWVRVLETGCHLLDTVKFTVSAKFVSVEKTGICR
jgi:hypothetical protein